VLQNIRSCVLGHRILSAVVVLLLIAFVLFAYLIHRARVQALDLQCESNCKWHVVAILEHEQRHNQLPPAHVDAPDGSRMHSWRALMTAEWVGSSVADFPYDFREPWNGPRNSQLANNNNHRLFVCPSDSGVPRNTCLTNYFVVEGANTAFPGARRLSVKNVQDRGRSNTILMVEASGLGIEWLEPRDLDYNTMSFSVNDPKRASVSSHHPDGPHACMADGSVRSLRDVSPEVLKATLNVPEGAWKAE
jgi:hypothetical protein